MISNWSSLCLHRHGDRTACHVTYSWVHVTGRCAYSERISASLKLWRDAVDGGGVEGGRMEGEGVRVVTSVKNVQMMKKKDCEGVGSAWVKMGVPCYNN